MVKQLEVELQYSKVART
jgi:hypothetical protein